MRAKAGFGRPITTNRLQSLQRELSSPKNKNFCFESNLRYKNGSDWRDWKALEGFGPFSSLSSQEVTAASRPWSVSSQTLRKWKDLSNLENFKGYVCICGHPEILHREGGLCSAGHTVCVCPKSRRVLLVDDIRYFLRVTKGPHEAHALVLGLTALEAKGGLAVKQIEWRCEYKSCGGITGVNPARFRNGVTLALGMPVHDLNRLICEPCLFLELNGGYVSA
jgi:hypothetical protein